MKADLKKLWQSYPDSRDLYSHIVSAVDLSLLSPASRLNLSLPSEGYGLAKLAAAVLKGRLNKAMQRSDWELRPLTSEHLEYAALDAEVLLHLHRALIQPDPTTGEALCILPDPVTINVQKTVAL